MNHPVVKIPLSAGRADEGHGPYGVVREHSTDHELMSAALREISEDELSGVQARPVPPPPVEESSEASRGAAGERSREARASGVKTPVEERLLPGAFTEAFMAMVPSIKLGRRFGGTAAQRDDRREKRKAERKARKKNRRTR